METEMEVEKVHKEIPPSKPNDRDVSFVHSIMHRFWNSVVAGKEVENWTRENVINYHTLLVRTMRRRGMQHLWRARLDTLSLEMLKVLEFPM